MLYIWTTPTPLGDVTLIACDDFLQFASFENTHHMDKSFQHFIKYYMQMHNDKKSTIADMRNFQSRIQKKCNAIIDHAIHELGAYFSKGLKEFQTPLQTHGTPFQRNVWAYLRTISWGKTQSYKSQSIMMDAPNSHRAVANANGMNPLSIFIPCHRVIASNGGLGVYSGGLDKKRWLLSHEGAINRFVDL